MPTAQDITYLRDTATFLQDELTAAGLNAQPLTNLTNINNGNFNTKFNQIEQDVATVEAEMDAAGSRQFWSTEAEALLQRVLVVLTNGLGGETAVAQLIKRMLRATAYILCIAAGNA